MEYPAFYTHNFAFYNPFHELFVIPLFNYLMGILFPLLPTNFRPKKSSRGFHFNLKAERNYCPMLDPGLITENPTFNCLGKIQDEILNKWNIFQLKDELADNVCWKEKHYYNELYPLINLPKIFSDNDLSEIFSFWIFKDFLYFEDVGIGWW